MRATLNYSDAAFATIEISSTEVLSNQALIKGSKGEMIVSSVVTRKTSIFSNEFFV